MQLQPVFGRGGKKHLPFSSGEGTIKVDYMLKDYDYDNANPIIVLYVYSQKKLVVYLRFILNHYKTRGK